MFDDLSFEEANSLLDYDPLTGILTWKPRENNKSFNTRFAGKEAGGLDNQGYLRIKYNKKLYMGHRIAYLLAYGTINSSKLIDHKNNIRDDNSKLNLREADHSLNSSNRVAINSLGLKNIYEARGKYRVRVKRNGKTYQLTLPELDLAIEFRDLLLSELY